MTNKPMLSVERELLATALKADASIGASAIELVNGWAAMAKLRALLDKPETPMEIGGYAPSETSGAQMEMSDEWAQEVFSKRMLVKLEASAAKGRNGWQQCSQESLSRMLREHVDKGDPVDVANFCMFLDALGYGIAPAAQHQGEPVAWRFRWDYDHGNGWCRNAVRFVESMEHVEHEDKSTWREVTPLYAEQPAPVAVVMPELESALEAWWESDGQYCRAGGGSYEKTFAYHAYEAALAEVARLNGVKP